MLTARVQRIVERTERGGAEAQHLKGSDMRYATLQTGLVLGLEYHPVKIEVSIANGLPSLSIAGLPSSAATDARVRIKSALTNQGFTLPNRRIVVNGQATSRKISPHTTCRSRSASFCHERRQLALDVDQIIFGELSLDGSICQSPMSMALAWLLVIMV